MNLEHFNQLLEYVPPEDLVERLQEGYSFIGYGESSKPGFFVKGVRLPHLFAFYHHDGRVFVQESVEFPDSNGNFNGTEMEFKNQKDFQSHLEHFSVKMDKAKTNLSDVLNNLNLFFFGGYWVKEDRE